MNENQGVSPPDIFRAFPNPEAGRKYLETRLWPNGARCPSCARGARVTTRKAGFYRCNTCKLDFTVRTGTLLERSHVPLHKWICAMYLFVTQPNGISSLQLAKQIQITQKSAWFVLKRLREARERDALLLRRVVVPKSRLVGGRSARTSPPSGKSAHRAATKRGRPWSSRLGGSSRRQLRAEGSGRTLQVTAQIPKTLTEKHV